MKKIIVVIVCLLILFVSGCSGAPSEKVSEDNLIDSEQKIVPIEDSQPDMGEETEMPLEEPEEYEGTAKEAEEEAVEDMDVEEELEEDTVISTSYEEDKSFNIVQPEKIPTSKRRTGARVILVPKMTKAESVTLVVKSVGLRGSSGVDVMLWDRGDGDKTFEILPDQEIVIGEGEIEPRKTYMDASIDLEQRGTVVVIDGKEKELRLENEKLNVRVQKNIEIDQTLEIRIPVDFDELLNTERTNLVKLEWGPIVQAEVELIAGFVSE